MKKIVPFHGAILLLFVYPLSDGVDFYFLWVQFIQEIHGLEAYKQVSCVYKEQ